MRKLLLFLFILILPFSANAATCSAGYYLDNGTCTTCPRKNYCPGDDKKYDCPNGPNGRPQWATPGSSSCTECPAVSGVYASRATGAYDYYFHPNNNEDGCYAHFINTESDAVYRAICYYDTSNHLYGTSGSWCQFYRPTYCAGGKYVAHANLQGTGSENYVSCNGLDCKQGQMCEDVGVGYYSPDGDLNRYACTTPPSGATATCSGTRNTQSWVCSSGYFQYGDYCFPVCSAGYYNDVNNNGACTICPAGYYCNDGRMASPCPGGYDYNTSTGKSAITQCQTHCNAGTYVASVSAYTQLEYIESTLDLHQYINTGYTPQTNTVSGSISFIQTQTTNSNNHVDMIGSSNLSIGYENGYFFVWSNTGGLLKYTAPFNIGTVYNIDFAITASSRTLTVNGTTVSDDKGGVSTGTLNLNRNGDDYWFIGKTYGMTIYDGGNLVFDLVPARRNSDSAVGMYNRVNGAFMVNSGSGNFVAGPVSSTQISSTCTDVGVGYYSTGETVNFGSTGTRTACTAPANASTTCSGTQNTNPWACNAGYYSANGTSCVDVGVGYYSPAGDNGRYACTNKPANSQYSGSGGAINSCPWECDAGYWNDNGTCTICPAGYACTNGVKTNCANVTGPNDRLTYSDTEGASACTECPAVTGALASRVSSYLGWWNSENIHNGAYGCYATFMDSDDDADFSTLCYYSTTDGAYGGAHSTCQTYRNNIAACAAGKYKTIESTPEYQSRTDTSAVCNGVDCMKGRVCTDVGTGYYSPVGDLNRYACTNKPANSSYSASGTSSSCPWTCDTNYWEYSNACHARCPYGDGELHVGQYTHPLWADITNVPSPSVYIGELGPNHDGLCYAYLEPDDTPVDNHHGFHTVHNGVPYHAINLGLYGLE